MKIRIRFLLMTSLFIMSVTPIVGAYYFLGNVLKSQSSVYNSAALREALSQSQNNLKSLSKYNPENEKRYRSEFERLQDLKLIFEDGDFFSNKINRSYSKYFIFILIAFVGLSLFFGFLISLYVDGQYRLAHNSFLEERKKVSYLEEMARWQESAKKLAHEIRRPLMPIRAWISNIKSSYINGTSESYEKVLTDGIDAINGELKTLNSMVDEFASFAKLPKAKLKNIDVVDLISKFCNEYKEIWSKVTLNPLETSNKFNANLDESLFRQVLVNLIENAHQANPEENIDINFKLVPSGNCWTLSVFNSGQEVDPSDSERIFDMYFSTKVEGDNMGLGLSIVRYLLIEQGCSIKNTPVKNGAQFDILIQEQLNGV